MKTPSKTEGEKTYFIITEVHETYHDTIRKLNFIQRKDGFAKGFPAESQHLEPIYQNFAHHAEEMILQAAGVHPVPWEQALLAFITKVKYRPDINWWLAGSTALAVRRLEIMPRDIDLILDDAGAQKLGELLLDYLIEPVQDA